ncbi:hypothetical protein TNCV_3621521 [Trichonephila clavipes]|nr:hypothetical protein TNCV_3621521 [Trichonephila clavipes]
MPANDATVNAATYCVHMHELRKNIKNHSVVACCPPPVGLSSRIIMLLLMWMRRAKHCYGNSAWKVLQYHAYSPDFSSRLVNTILFDPFQKTLKERRFPEDNIQAAVENWFHDQHQIFTQGIHHVVDHWDTCLNLQCFFS